MQCFIMERSISQLETYLNLLCYNPTFETKIIKTKLPKEWVHSHLDYTRKIVSDLFPKEMHYTPVRKKSQILRKHYKNRVWKANMRVFPRKCTSSININNTVFSKSFYGTSSKVWWLVWHNHFTCHRHTHLPLLKITFSCIPIDLIFMPVFTY